MIDWNDDFDLVVKTQMAKIPRVDRLIELVGVAPGMNVLDIGAGTGRVYATDIDPNMVEYLAEQSRTRGLSNLEVALVKADGLDAFYLKHRYDLVLVYDVFPFTHDRVDYFRRLGKLLSPSGRIAIPHDTESFFSFARNDFDDWDGFIEDLKLESPMTPFGRELALPALSERGRLPGQEPKCRRRSSCSI